MEENEIFVKYRYITKKAGDEKKKVRNWRIDLSSLNVLMFVKGSRKCPYPYHRRSLEISMGVGGLKCHIFFWEKYKAKLKF